MITINYLKSENDEIQLVLENDELYIDSIVKFMNKIQAKQDDDIWIINRENKELLDNFVYNLNNPFTFRTKSRKNQSKFHRAISREYDTEDVTKATKEELKKYSKSPPPKKEEPTFIRTIPDIRHYSPIKEEFGNLSQNIMNLERNIQQLTKNSLK